MPQRYEMFVVAFVTICNDHNTNKWSQFYDDDVCAVVVNDYLSWGPMMVWELYWSGGVDSHLFRKYNCCRCY